jgi:hypothetical protein
MDANVDIDWARKVKYVVQGHKIIVISFVERKSQVCEGHPNFNTV